MQQKSRRIEETKNIERFCNHSGATVNYFKSQMERKAKARAASFAVGLCIICKETASKFVIKHRNDGTPVIGYRSYCDKHEDARPMSSCIHCCKEFKQNWKKDFTGFTDYPWCFHCRKK
jgi:hypothetical protein